MFDIGLIRDNFLEIHHAIHHPNPELGGLKLVANLSGTRIYDSTRGWGYLWCWFYRFADWFTGKEIRLDKLKCAVLHTHHLFHRTLPLIQEHLTSYETYLQRLGAGYAVVEDHFYTTRRSITLWNDACQFIRMLPGLRHSKLQKLLNLCFGQQFSMTQLAGPAAEGLYECQKIIDLEGISDGPLPLEIFKKILRKKPLNQIDNKSLGKWIKKINNAPSCVNTLHKGISAIAARYTKNERPEAAKMANVVTLEAFLEDRGCTVFQQDDPSHMLWRHGLKKGKLLNYYNKTITLGAQIVSSTSEKDSTVVFSLEDRPQQVLVVGQNKAALSIRRFRLQGKNVGIQSVQFLDISSNGRWALMERLQPLNSHKWSSSGCINSKDSDLMNALGTLLESFVKRNFTPANFCLSNIMVDAQFHLKALKPITEEMPFDFNALEEFAFLCAAGNLTIFKHLMTMSGLSAHFTARFYNELIKNALNGDKTSIEDMSGICKISDPRVVDKGKAFVREILNLRNRLCMKIHEMQPNKDLKVIEKEVSNQILICHNATKACGILWPSLAQDVLRY